MINDLICKECKETWDEETMEEFNERQNGVLRYESLKEYAVDVMEYHAAQKGHHHFLLRKSSAVLQITLEVTEVPNCHITPNKTGGN